MPTKTSAKIYQGTARNLARLARALARGELVAVPTETVYGLAGDALNPQVCRKIFSAKGRPAFDPLIVHIASLAQLDLVATPNPAAEKLAAAFWPGPLTLVLPKKAVIPDLVTSGKSTVAVRMPRHRLFRTLLKLCGRPLAAPSANRFGYVSPTTAAHVLDGLGKKIRYVLDGGDCEIGLESTIVDLRDPARPIVLRPGAISAADLSRVLGLPVKTAKKKSLAPKTAAIAPGLLSRHYSPRKPVALHRQLTSRGVANLPTTEACVFLFRPRFAKGAPYPRNVFWLAKKNDLGEAAHALFAMLRRLDGEKWKKIHIERAPGESALSIAINDRLTRAAARR